MKILDILFKESFDFGDDDDASDSAERFTAPKVAVADLNSLQLRMLKILHDDPAFGEREDLRSKDLDMILSLHDDGFIDSDWALTDSGLEAISASDEPNIPRTMNTDNNMDSMDTLYHPLDGDGDDGDDIDYNPEPANQRSSY